MPLFQPSPYPPSAQLPVRKLPARWWPWAVLLLLLAGRPAVRGQQLYFCESVDSAGRAMAASNTFSLDPRGSFLNVLIRMPAPVETGLALFDLYRLDSAGHEHYESTSRLTVTPGWTWFNKGFTFYRPGDYVLYVYDDREKLIITGRLKLVKQ
jgi:hypothetical protein